MIGDDTAITVLGIKGSVVWIDVGAPDDAPRPAGEMLKIGESTMIDDDVSIKILSRSGNQVSIGITAPEDVPVHRLEIYDKIQEEKERES